MKIAFLGSRGIPARYSGFETFYEQLAIRLAERGHQVTVYNRSHFIKDVRREYKGVRIVRLPAIRSKHLETISHTFLSTMHALFQRYDIVYYCIVGNAPLVWMPRIVRARVLLNVDGEDWAREKWSGFARWYQHKCEWLAPRAASLVISDAHSIRARYSELYGARTVFVPYGANIQFDDRLDALKKWDLRSREYILFVGRLVPENGADLLIRAFKQIKTEKRLVIVGDAPYVERYKKELRDLAPGGTVFTGYTFGDDYVQLSSHAYLYVQPSGVDGTRPALLDQLGIGNCMLVRDSKANMEVIGGCGHSFSRSDAEKSLGTELQKLLDSPDLVKKYRGMARQRIEEYYNWQWITLFYEDLFNRLVRRRGSISYDEFLDVMGSE